jgi:ABC-type transporter Mla maintaining outer membrane lipid asymmetry ATPase subunit MlaF
MTVASEIRIDAELRAAHEQALSCGRHALDRLAHAATSVTFRIAGAPERSFTLLLDRRPCAVIDAEPAEIEIELAPDQAERAAVGGLSLTSAVISGLVRYSGPVRRYLEVEPILRSVLAEQAGRDPHDPALRGGGHIAGSVDADLLAIETRGLRKSFGTNAVLRGLDIEIPEGTISVVLGPSGTGKSVLLQHIIGVMKPDAGDVIIRGRPLSQMSRGEILGLRRGIGVMFQDGALFSAMDVFDNVAFPLRQHTNLNDAEVREVVAQHLASVGLADAGERMPSQLSGGMRKRAGLARALVLNPSIILCDEPDSGLDPVRTALLADLLVAQHNRHGGTMVVVTHNVMLASHIADHMSILWRGRVLEAGMTRQIMASDTPFIQQFLAGDAQGPLGMDA